MPQTKLLKPAARSKATDHQPAAACGCAIGPGGRAAGVDAAAKAKNLNRLRRIEGQVRGLQQMVSDERYCADVLMQISSVQEALRAVTRELMRNHLKHCATEAIRKGPEEAEAMYDELASLMHKHAR